jgi:hypothetical protein
LQALARWPRHRLPSPCQRNPKRKQNPHPKRTYTIPTPSASAGLVRSPKCQRGSPQSMDCTPNRTYAIRTPSVSAGLVRSPKCQRGSPQSMWHIDNHPQPRPLAVAFTPWISVFSASLRAFMIQPGELARNAFTFSLARIIRTVAASSG